MGLVSVTYLTSRGKSTYKQSAVEFPSSVDGVNVLSNTHRRIDATFDVLLGLLLFR